jgi:L-ascorbate metabolism protein UlaG (beta-lactamase superfamily)
MNNKSNQWLKLLLLTTLVMTINKSMATGAEMSNALANKRLESSHLEDGAYVNVDPQVKQDMSKLGGIIKRYIFEKRIDPEPTKVPLSQIDMKVLEDDSKNAVYRLGHSSVLLKLNNQVWLSDPVFSERASPVQWMGPKRFHPVPLEFEQLKSIKGVIISHDHYDHLDKNTIQLLSDRVEHFIVPLGVDKHLLEWGIPKEKIHALDWWQEVTIDGVKLVATPAQHFSGRGVFDGNETLWASWVIKTSQHTLFFSGDSGYFDGFKLIGERYGPFDLTMMETGAYDKDWADIHMLPEQTVQAHLDLNGRVLMPVHNGTFDLALHPWYEPFARLSKAAASHNIEVVTPIMGEKVLLNQPRTNQRWWAGSSQTTDELSYLAGEAK